MNKQKLSLLALLAINIIPIIGVALKAWEWHDILYLYWGECAIVGIISLISYAKYLLVFSIILGAAALTLHINDIVTPETIKLVLTFWVLYSLCWLGYFEIGNSALNIKMHRYSPFAKFTLYLGFMTVSIVTCSAITLLLYGVRSNLHIFSQDTLIIFTSLSILVPTLTIACLRIIHIVGAKHFLHFLFGTYHTPKESDKIVLFLDMIDSTKMAEKLSPKESMLLISRFIFEASAIIRRYGGDIINYTGDGLVVTWPINKADRSIEAIHNMRKRFNKTRPRYQREFGVKPYFRMGLHAGPVVISQIGEEKLFLGLYGDTVNTASRLEQMNKDLETHVLISEPVASRLSLKWASKLLPLGPKVIPGRKEPIEAYALRLRADTPDTSEQTER